jgi:hypothetical protein
MENIVKMQASLLLFIAKIRYSMCVLGLQASLKFNEVVSSSIHCPANGTISLFVMVE